MERTGKSLKKSELEILHELPRDSSDKTIKLFGMLYESTVSFLKSHSLKLNMPEESITRTLVEGKSFVSIKYFDYAIVHVCRNYVWTTNVTDSRCHERCYKRISVPFTFVISICTTSNLLRINSFSLRKHKIHFLSQMCLKKFEEITVLRVRM